MVRRNLSKAPADVGVADDHPSPSREDQAAGPVLRFEDAAGGFLLTAVGVQVERAPTFESFRGALHAASYLADKSPFWTADLLEYAFRRPEWHQLIDAVIDAGTFSASTVRQYRFIARTIPAEARVVGVSFGHHQAVADQSLSLPERTRLLTEARDEHLSVSDLRVRVRRAKGVKRVAGGQAPELQRLQEAVTKHAHEAAHLCRQIPLRDCGHGERLLQRAWVELGKVEEALGKFRRAQGHYAAKRRKHRRGGV
jgi:hypothetical protein